MNKLYILLVSILISATISAQDFTIGAIPDIQNVSTTNINKMMQFYIDNETSLNLLMVTSLGDIVYGYTSHSVMDGQYSGVKPAFENLTTAGIPWVPCPGNHDGQSNDESFALYNSWFPLSELQAQNPYFTDNLNGTANSAYLFSASGMDFVMVAIETHDQFIIQDWQLDYDQASIDWANAIFQQYPNRRGIFVTHDMYEWSGYKLVEDIIKKNDNIFMAMCGHSCSRTGFDGGINGELHWTETTNGGSTVHCLLSNYQCDGDGGATNRYYTFKPSENKIYAYTYNVVEEVYRTDDDSQFTIDYQMTIPTVPVISGISHDPVYPLSSETPTVTATIKDDVSVASATINWGTSSGILSNSVTMTTTGSDIYIGNIPANTDGSTIYYTVSGTDGDNNTTTSSENSYVICDDKSCLTCPDNPTQTAYGDNIPTIPGTVEAENYNIGCHTVAYYDSDAENQGDKYRTEEVDIEACDDGGYNVGYIATDEWLNYTVNVETTGVYSLDFRIASSSDGSEAYIETDGENISGNVTLPATGGWQTWSTVTVENISLTKGEQVLKLYITDGDFNLNYINFTLTSQTSDPVISNISATPSAPGSSDDVSIRATITDDVSIASAVINWGTSSGVLSDQVNMSSNGDTYSGVIPAQINGTTVYYKILASDGDGNDTTSQEYNYTVSDVTTINWYSYDVMMSSGSPKATVTGGSITANLELYESSNADGVDQGTELSTYVDGTHSDGFSNVQTYWHSGSYPYAGKSTITRGDDTGEANTPDPTGVYDLQLHPPNNTNLTVCAFVIPVNGKYNISGLAARRIASGGVNTTLKVFDGTKTLIAEITATNDQDWVTDAGEYDLGTLSADTKIYFAVDNTDGYSYDATEIVWTVTLSDNITTSIEKYKDQIKVYPNPTSGSFQLSVINNHTKYTYELFDYTGKLLLKSSNSDHPSIINVDISNYPSGIYFLKVHSLLGIDTRKIIKH